MEKEYNYIRIKDETICLREKKESSFVDKVRTICSETRERETDIKYFSAKKKKNSNQWIATR